MRDHLIVGRVVVRILKSYENMGVLRIEARSKGRQGAEGLADKGSSNSSSSSSDDVSLGSIVVDCMWPERVSESSVVKLQVQPPPPRALAGSNGQQENADDGGAAAKLPDLGAISGGGGGSGREDEDAEDGGLQVVFSILEAGDKRAMNKVKILEVKIM